MMRSKRAALAALAGILDQVSRVGVNVAITPVLVSTLGAAGFGIWQILFKLQAQIAPLDGRSPETLKWVVASQQDSIGEVQAESLASAFLVLLIYAPLVIFVYVFAYFAVPIYLALDESKTSEVRLVLILLCVTTLVLSVAQTFEACVRGMNLAYKLLGVQSLVTVVGGLLMVISVRSGYGLIGLAYSQVAVAIISVPIFFLVAKRAVSWLSIKRPLVSNFLKYLNRTKWFVLWELLSLWMLAGEVIVLGAFVEPEVVSKYVITMFSTQVVTIAIITGVSSALPGLSQLISNGRKAVAASVWKESLLISWILSLTICCVILMINKSFVSLWVGDELYAGDFVNALLVLCVLQLVFIRHDSFVLNIALDVKKKVILGMISAALSFLLLMVLVPRYGMVGVCYSLLLARSILTISYPYFVQKLFGKDRMEWLDVSRYIVISAPFLLTSFFLSKYIYLSSWFDLAVSAATISFVLLVLITYIGASRNQKLMLLSRIKTIVSKRH